MALENSLHIFRISFRSLACAEGQITFIMSSMVKELFFPKRRWTNFSQSFEMNLGISSADRMCSQFGSEFRSPAAVMSFMRSCMCFAAKSLNSAMSTRPEPSSSILVHKLCNVRTCSRWPWGSTRACCCSLDDIFALSTPKVKNLNIWQASFRSWLSSTTAPGGPPPANTLVKFTASSTPKSLAPRRSKADPCELLVSFAGSPSPPFSIVLVLFFPIFLANKPCNKAAEFLFPPDEGESTPTLSSEAAAVSLLFSGSASSTAVTGSSSTGSSSTMQQPSARQRCVAPLRRRPEGRCCRGGEGGGRGKFVGRGSKSRLRLGRVPAAGPCDRSNGGMGRRLPTRSVPLKDFWKSSM
mmetsp:Transcript_14436/g.36446  ORF Transcript_14436/g.36446 Transcript_14436/m.36446 type:complete len:354 (-) Transcript_14436:311-1372(-)